MFDDVLVKTADDTQIHVVHGEPLLHGKAGDKGLRLNPRILALEALTLSVDGVADGDIMVHHETNPVLAKPLATRHAPLPVAMGVIQLRQALTCAHLSPDTRARGTRRQTSRLTVPWGRTTTRTSPGCRRSGQWTASSHL